MELLSPAGNSQKLYYAYAYGADAAYIGLKQFSLRAKQLCIAIAVHSFRIDERQQQVQRALIRREVDYVIVQAASLYEKRVKG